MAFSIDDTSLQGAAISLCVLVSLGLEIGQNCGVGFVAQGFLVLGSPLQGTFLQGFQKFFANMVFVQDSLELLQYIFIYIYIYICTYTYIYMIQINTHIMDTYKNS